MVTEQTATQSLEEVLTPSTETEEVSEENANEVIEPTEEKEEDPQKAFESKVQAEADRRVNPYREKREADTALIRKLQTEVKELKSVSGVNKLSKTIQAVLDGDEESGIEPDKLKDREKALEEMKGMLKDYREKSDAVGEAVQFIDAMVENVAKPVVKEFGLDDPNPAIRAMNGAKFLDEVVSLHKRNLDFQRAVEKSFPTGGELRKWLEESTNGQAEFENDKSKELYLENRMKGFKNPPTKKPPALSAETGSEVTSSSKPSELISKGLGKMK